MNSGYKKKKPRYALYFSLKSPCKRTPSRLPIRTPMETAVRLILNLIMSYIYGAHCKARNFSVIYIFMDLRFATLKAVSLYLLNNVSTLNQCKKFFCVKIVCKHFASYQDYPNYKPLQILTFSLNKEIFPFPRKP
jgi:hypothetical protein